MHRFLTPTQFHGNVVLNFGSGPIDELEAFAAGYKQAASTLAKELEASPGYADYEGYPIVFLYRHALELYLKVIVLRGANLAELLNQGQIQTERILQRHELTWMLPALSAIFRQMNCDFSGSGFDSLADFEDFVRDFDRIDPKSFSFRYPIDTRGQAALPRHFVVNVIQLAASMDQVLSFLGSLAEVIAENWRLEAEARYELQTWANEL